MDFFDVDNLLAEQDLFDLANGANALNDAWTVPSFRHAFPEQIDFSERIGESIGTQGIKRARGRTFTGCETCRERKIKCDGRRPICHNCQKSRGYTCRGFVENSRRTGAGCSKPAPKVRRAESRRHIVNPSHHQSHHGQSINSQDVSHLSQRQLLDEESVRSASDMVVGDATHEDLLHHYRSIVTVVMMPTIDPASNPWLQIYFSLAFGDPSTTSQLALRHALISVAAYQRASQRTGLKRIDIERGRTHGQEAEKLLEQVVCDREAQHIQSTRDKCTSMAAALSLISVDIFDPRGVDCRAHLLLARRIIRLYAIEKTWKSNAILNMLYQIFRCYETVASSARLAETSGPPPSQHQDPALDFRDPDEGFIGHDVVEDLEQSVTDPDQFILNSSFGVSWPTLSALQQTIKLGSLCAATPSASPTLLGQVEDLHSHLYSFEDDPSQFLVFTSMDRNISCLANGVLASDSGTASSSAMLPKVISDELVENLQSAFHYAVIVYFYRIIPDIYLAALHNDTPDSPVICSVTERFPQKRGIVIDHQTLISNIWDRLENLDSITPRETQLHRGNVLWPAFIAAVESIQIELRHRALIWFSKASKRGVGNVLGAKKVVLEVWRRVDRLHSTETEQSGLGPVDWRAVMQDMNIFLMLT